MSNNNILIGIISYLPDNKELREHRLESLLKLIHKCNYLFDLHIYVVTQNYSDEERQKLSNISNVECSLNYPKLGILQARRELRNDFLHSSYSNLIMLDDDCIISGSIQDARNYIKQIENNKDCFIEFNESLLKLFCISKEIFKEVDYEDVNPELEEGFEDRVFVSKLRKLYKDKRRVFDRGGLEECSISTKDKYSTWYIDQNLNRMLEKTYKKEKLC